MVAGLKAGSFRHEAFRGDPVNRAGQRVVEILVPADPRVDPVGDVDRAVGTDGDVRRPEQRGDRAGDAAAAAEEIRSGVLLLHVRGEEDLPFEREARALTGRLIREHLVASRLGREERPFPRRAERAVLVEHIAGRRAAAVHVARRHHAGVVLAPLRGRNRLAGPAVRLPGALAVVRREPEVGVLHHPAHAACRRIVVVVLEDVAQRGHGLLVAVAVVVADDLRGGAVGIHANRESPHVHVPVVAGLPGMLRGVVRILERADGAGPIGPEDAERLPRPIREHRAAVARVEHPLAIRADRHRVKRVVVVDAHEAGQEHFARVDCRIEAQVAIDVGIDDEIGRLRDDYLVVDHRHAERGDQPGFLHERMSTVRFAVAVGVLQHDDAIALGAPRVMGAVANPLGHPDAPVTVDIEVGRVVQHRRCGPQGDFESVRHLEEVERNVGGLSGGDLTGLRSGGLTGLHRRRPERLLRYDGRQDQHEHHVQRQGKSTHKSPIHVQVPDPRLTTVAGGLSSRGLLFLKCNFTRRRGAGESFTGGRPSPGV